MTNNNIEKEKKMRDKKMRDMDWESNSEREKRVMKEMRERKDNEVEVVRRGGGGGEVEVKVWPADNVLRRVEKLQERGMVTDWVFKELGDIVNELKDDVMEVVDSDRGRNLKTGDPWYDIRIRLGEGGKHLKNEEIEYIVSWALEEYGKKEVDRRVGYLPI